MKSSPLTPPGPTIGLVWIVLFGLMGYARHRIRTSPEPTAARDATAVTGLVALIAAYPAYTPNLRNLRVALAGNVATLVAALAVTRLVRRSDRRAARALLPVDAWLGFAIVLTSDTMRRSRPSR